MPTELRAKKAVPEWSSPDGPFSDPNPIATVQVCVIGLLVMLVVMLSFPDFGVLIEQYNKF